MNYTLLNQNSCNLCPRNCKTNRFEKPGAYCQIDHQLYIAAIVNHKGEEPVISGKNGICNVFFIHCNLQCVYCQNWQISRNTIPASKYKISLKKAVDQIIQILDTGVPSLGFVSPSHNVTQMLEIINLLHQKNYYPTIVYNTNAYDNVSTLQQIKDVIDVYLPDLKYMSNTLARKYSKVGNYVEIATAAIKEMFEQKSSTLLIDDNGYAYFGLIIRHLILPNNIENSKKVLDFIAKELSTNIYISLMAQYYPAADAWKYPELSRTLTPEEYNQVVDYMNELGFSNGWIQFLDSAQYYTPDFTQKHPFEYSNSK